MCLFQISTLHSTLGTQSETQRAAGRHREVRAAPGVQESCQGPPSTSASFHVFLGSSHFLLTQRPCFPSGHRAAEALHESCGVTLLCQGVGNEKK